MYIIYQCSRIQPCDSNGIWIPTSPCINICVLSLHTKTWFAANYSKFWTHRPCLFSHNTKINNAQAFRCSTVGCSSAFNLQKQFSNTKRRNVSLVNWMVVCVSRLDMNHWKQWVALPKRTNEINRWKEAWKSCRNCLMEFLLMKL